MGVRWDRLHPEEVAEYMRKANRKYYRKNRLRIIAHKKEKDWSLFCQCLDHYGHACCLCGRTDHLCLDHIGGNNGDSPRGNRPLWKWLIKNNFPEDFRTLCVPCNTWDGKERKKIREELGMEEIIIDVDEEGVVEVKTHGFKGKGCVKASQFIEEALGKITSTKKTAEYYAEELKERVKVNHG